MTTRQRRPTRTSTTILSGPVSLANGMLAAVIAGPVFQRIWKRIEGGEGVDPAGPRVES